MIFSFEGLELGILFFRWNGLLIAFGVACSALLSVYEARRRGFDSELIYYLFVPLVIWGIVLARLWYVFTPSLSSVQLGLTTSYYLSHPLEILAFWVGGYGIPGAWLGGFAALFFFSRQYQIPFWRMADIIAPGVALAQAMGRLGNYFNQELYGLPSNLPWKIFIAPEYRLAGFEAVEYYHPLFAYESLLNFASLLFLMRLARRETTDGRVFLSYLAIYSFIRFILEFLRLDVSLIASGVNINQVFFIILFSLSAVLLCWRGRFAKL